MKHWKQFPREVVDAPAQAAFQVRLDWDLSNLVQWKVALLIAGGLDWINFKGLFQPRQLCDSGKSEKLN